MFMTAGAVVASGARRLVAIALVAAAFALIGAWYHQLPALEVEGDHRVPYSPWARLEAWRPAFDLPTAMLSAGAWLLLRIATGRLLDPSRILLKSSKSRPARSVVEAGIVSLPDGMRFYRKTCGPADPPTVMLTHRRSHSSEEWTYSQNQCGDQFRVVIWDFPEHDRSTQPDSRDDSLDKMVHQLLAVMEYHAESSRQSGGRFRTESVPAEVSLSGAEIARGDAKIKQEPATPSLALADEMISFFMQRRQFNSVNYLHDRVKSPGQCPSAMPGLDCS